MHAGPAAALSLPFASILSQRLQRWRRTGLRSAKPTQAGTLSINAQLGSRKPAHSSFARPIAVVLRPVGAEVSDGFRGWGAVLAMLRLSRLSCKRQPKTYE